MANEEPVSTPDPEEEEEDPQDDDLDSDKSSESEYDSDYDSDDYNSHLLSMGIIPEGYEPPENVPEETSTFTPQEFVDEALKTINHPPLRKMQAEAEERFLTKKDPFDFPYDPENWSEKDLQELWTTGPPLDNNTGWDPDWAGRKEWEQVAIGAEHGLNPRIAPFYVPYRKPYPVLPKVIPYLRNPLNLLEELDRIEEVLKWVSYIFPNGNTYEGTVWDDLAQGKGVLVANNGLVRYEGEWFQNDPEGHGVVEVDIPDIEPVPGSKLEDDMRAEGKIISMDYIPPEDKEWLKKDIEDSIDLAGGRYEIPFYENKEWIRQFGKKPETGRYRYAGQWKHGRMHGCGVYEVNERIRYGRFYFGELLEDTHGCDEKISAMHSGIAEVAAAKARMFVNKPDGMVREERGPYGDPQHAYLYEGEDVWMAPGFINQFYEVPEYWKRYAAEVDTEREMWLNSFYRAPLRLPMPAELEHWWQKDHIPEFILVNKEHDPEVDDPSDPHPEDPLIVHTPSGRIINFVEDEEHGVRLFWQPKLKDGEDVDPDKVAFLPVGYDDYYGIEEEVKKETFLERVGKACQTVFDKLDKWVEDSERDSEKKIKEMEHKLEIIDAEICLDEAYEEMDLELKEMEEEEERKEKEAPKVDIDKETVPEEKVVVKEAEMEDFDEGEGDDEEEEEEEEEEEAAGSSFGTVRSDDGSSFSKNSPGKTTPKEPPFSALSLGFASCSLISAVSSRLHPPLISEKKSSFKPAPPPSCPTDLPRSFEVVCYPPQTLPRNWRLRAVRQGIHPLLHLRKPSKVGSSSQLHSLSRILSSCLSQAKARTNVKRSRMQCNLCLEEEVDDSDLGSILSLHHQINVPEWCTATGMLS